MCPTQSTLLKLATFICLIYLCRCAKPVIRVETNKTYHYDNKKGDWVDKQINCYLDNFNNSVLNLTIYKDKIFVYTEDNKTHSYNVAKNVPGLMANVSRVGFGKLLVAHRTMNMSGNYNFSVWWGTPQKANFTSAVVYISGSSIISAINYQVISLIAFMYLLISKFQ